uniref:AAA domain-containing protein n=1 Tax=Steinernema glaseri TaxID=37863 RepID=A0A1I7ZZG5_9BILA
MCGKESSFVCFEDGDLTRMPTMCQDAEMKEDSVLDLTHGHVEIRIRPKFRLQQGIHYDEICASISGSFTLHNCRPIDIPEGLPFSAEVDRITVHLPALPEFANPRLTAEQIRSLPCSYYKLTTESPVPFEIDTGDEEGAISSHQVELPNYEYEDIWENLIYSDNVKSEMIAYIEALMRLSAAGVNTNIINMNRLVLLHGPPGTGKTSFCKGIAQRLSIRLNNTFKRSVMVEINSHSLFSRWFSESGKLVQKMFEQIEALTEDKYRMVFVLIDEVESLSMSRKTAMNRNEPSDAVRVVNALLTQIDRVRKRPNVLIFTTSNLTEVMDDAFVDRADIVRYLGRPSVQAVSGILTSCISELERVGMLINELSAEQHRELLIDLSTLITEKNLSARTVRQIPVQAMAQTLKSNNIVTRHQFFESCRRIVASAKSGSSDSE